MNDAELEENEALLEAKRVRFKEMQMKWVETRTLGGGAAEVKVWRKAAFEWLAGTHHMLQLMGHLGGWLDFVPRPVTSPECWKFCCVTADTGSDGYAALNFLQHGLGANVAFYADPSHAFQRSVQQSWTDLHWMAWCKVMIVPLNLLHGPWAGGSRYHELRKSGEELAALLEHGQHAFLVEHEAIMLEELGLLHHQGAENAGQLLRQAAQRACVVSSRGDKVAFCRFGSLIDSLGSLRNSWHMYQLRLLHALMDSKSFSTDTLQQSVKQTAKKRDTENIQSRAPVKAPVLLRDSCHSNVALSLAVLSDEAGQQRARVIEVFSRPLRAWHGHQASQLRSSQDYLDWFCEQSLEDLSGELSFFESSCHNNNNTMSNLELLL